MNIILVFIIIVLLVLLVATKISLTAYIAWMVENDFKQPSDKDMGRLIRWLHEKVFKRFVRRQEAGAREGGYR